MPLRVPAMPLRCSGRADYHCNSGSVFARWPNRLRRIGAGTGCLRERRRLDCGRSLTCLSCRLRGSRCPPPRHPSAEAELGLAKRSRARCFRMQLANERHVHHGPRRVGHWMNPTGERRVDWRRCMSMPVRAHLRLLWFLPWPLDEIPLRKRENRTSSLTGFEQRTEVLPAGRSSDPTVLCHPR